eukprot:12746881-Prorocentrum_lima.AAC.1
MSQFHRSWSSRERPGVACLNRNPPFWSSFGARVYFHTFCLCRPSRLVSFSTSSSIVGIAATRFPFLHAGLLLHMLMRQAEKLHIRLVAWPLTMP